MSGAPRRCVVPPRRPVRTSDFVNEQIHTHGVTLISSRSAGVGCAGTCDVDRRSTVGDARAITLMVVAVTRAATEGTRFHMRLG
jgi:hypothetical protein